METQEMEAIELNEVLITKKAYPIIWIGENGFNITRYGKLLRVKPSYFRNQEEMQLVIPIADLETGHIIFVPNRWYIVAGGVDTKLAFVREIVFIHRNEEEIVKDIILDSNLPIDTEFELATGVKQKTYAVIYEKLYHPDMFEPLILDEGKSIIAKLYPETFRIFKQNNKLFIEYLQLEDC
jgi:hypothetical protein